MMLILMQNQQDQLVDMPLKIYIRRGEREREMEAEENMQSEIF